MPRSRPAAGGDRSAAGAAALLVGAIVLVAAFVMAQWKPALPPGSFRDSLRAYHGAPPTIPHAVVALGRQDCVACHRAPADVARGPLRFDDGSVAIAMPHAFTGASCLQCHVEQAPRTKPYRTNAFVGAAEPGAGERAYAGAPPVIPHGTFARSLCLSCHGEGGYAAIRTSHPDRVNCRQCHVTADPRARAGLATNTFGARGKGAP